MLGAVFKVLGIIGIILLVILAIAILLILFVVIAPLNYKFIFDYDKESARSNKCYLKLNWLCHIVRCRIDIGLHGIDYELRLFGIKSRLLDKYLGKEDEYFDEYMSSKNDSDNNKQKDLVEDNKELVNNYDKDDYDYNDYEALDYENDSDNKMKNISEHEMLLDEIEEIWEDIISESEYEYDDFQDDNKFRFWWKNISWKKIFGTNPIKLIVGYIKILVKKIKVFFEGMLKTINALLRKYELVVDLWEKRSTQVAIERIIDYVYRLGKHIKPKKTKIRVNYGFEDPAFTGQVLGAVGVVYGFVGDIIEVNPDFEEEKMKIDCLISGKMRVLNLGIIVIKVTRDKVLKRLLKNIDKLKEDLKDDRQ